MAFRIIPFKPGYAERFRDLNIYWLEKYFRVEEKDRQMLEDCEEQIIKPGGKIFLASLGDQIVGCFALIKLDEGIYELGKMAVDPEYQGKNIGQELMRHAIVYGRRQQWNKIVLYSNSKLSKALHIYSKFGFMEVALEKDLPYIRSDIKMELVLT